MWSLALTQWYWTSGQGEWPISLTQLLHHPGFHPSSVWYAFLKLWLMKISGNYMDSLSIDMECWSNILSDFELIPINALVLITHCGGNDISYLTATDVNICMPKCELCNYFLFSKVCACVIAVSFREFTNFFYITISYLLSWCLYLFYYFPFLPRKVQLKKKKTLSWGSYILLKYFFYAQTVWAKR